ncbi:Trp biosynthesis-associated membrane protein [Myceligenerans crystallogenes]|uniref:Tryptophan-associated transmembrane protein (Trp_oprn_chp) n=1 Tax=Myceligenerans crystallogenes TaxID=316335 RepID=A0ABP4ZIF1_9MICO
MTTTTPAARPALTRTRALLALLALGGLALATTSATWITSEVATALRAGVAVEATGTQAAPVVSAAALVLLACGPVLALTGRAAKYVVLAVAVLAGAGVTAGAVAGVVAPATAARSAAADAAGVTELTAPAVLTLWPWVTAAAGVLAALVAVAAALAARRWPEASRRHERDAARPGVAHHTPAGPAAPAGAPAAQRDEPDPAADWDALTRGEDPTRDDG